MTHKALYGIVITSAGHKAADEKLETNWNMKTLPKTVIDWIKPHIRKMTEIAGSDRSGVCRWKSGQSVALYVHTAAVPADSVPPGSVAGQDMVYIEWAAMAGYSDDPMSFGAALLTPRDDRRICAAALTWEESLAI